MVDRFICTDDKQLEDEPFRYTIYSVYKIEKTECNRQFHNADFLYFVCVLCSTDCVSLDKSSRNSATKSSISEGVDNQSYSNDRTIVDNSSSRYISLSSKSSTYLFHVFETQYNLPLICVSDISDIKPIPFSNWRKNNV